MKYRYKWKKEERGSALLLVMVFTAIFLVMMLILFSELLINWKVYSLTKAKFLSQMMVSDVVAVTRFEEMREIVDNDEDLSYIKDVWEAPVADGRFIPVLKYKLGLDDDFNWLKYHSFPDISGLSSYGINRSQVVVPSGSFLFVSSNLGSDLVPNYHDVDVIAVVASPGTDVDSIYADLKNGFDTFTTTEDDDVIEKYKSSLADVSFYLFWQSAENVVIATGNAKEWGEQLRVKGDVWEKPAPDWNVNFRPVRSILNTWEVYGYGDDDPFAESKLVNDFYTVDNHLIDSVIRGKYNYGGDYFTIDDVPFGKDGAPCDSSDLIADDADVCDLKTGGTQYIDVFDEGKYRRYVAISYKKKIVSNDAVENEYDITSDSDMYDKEKMPWYRYVTQGNWSTGSGDIEYISWEYHVVNDLMRSPTEALQTGHVSSTFGRFYTQKVLPLGYTVDNSTLFNVFFDEDWDSLVRNGVLAPVNVAKKEKDYYSINDSDSYVITLYTKDESDGVHTILRYAPGSCEYKHGCELTGDSNDIDLQATSSTGKGILVDFGDDADLYLVTPCQPGYDTWLPIWGDLCHVVYDQPTIPSDIGKPMKNSKKFSGVKYRYIYRWLNGDPLPLNYSWGSKTFNLRYFDWNKVSVEKKSGGNWVSVGNLYDSLVPNEVRQWIIDDITSALSDYPDYFLLYPDDSINPLVSDTSYNPNWIYEWTRVVPITEKGFENYFGSYSKNNVEAKIYHPNWKNMIQYNFNITIIGKDLRILGDVIVVPPQSSNPEFIYETDFSATPTKNSDIANLSRFPQGKRLGFLIKGYNDVSEAGNNGFAVWFWDKIGYMGYSSDTEDARKYDFLSKGNKYGFRFSSDPDIYLGKDYKNRDMRDDEYANDKANCYGWELYEWDRLFYADVFVRSGGVGMVYKDSAGVDLTDADTFDYDVYKYPTTSENFRLLGSMLMNGGREVYAPVVYEYDCPYTHWTHTEFDPGWGFMTPIYYLPDNALTNRVRYWLVATDPRLVNVNVGDIRMRR